MSSIRISTAFHHIDSSTASSAHSSSPPDSPRPECRAPLPGLAEAASGQVIPMTPTAWGGSQVFELCTPVGSPPLGGRLPAPTDLPVLLNDELDGVPYVPTSPSSSSSSMPTPSRPCTPFSPAQSGAGMPPCSVFPPPLPCAKSQDGAPPRRVLRPSGSGK